MKFVYPLKDFAKVPIRSTVPKNHFIIRINLPVLN